MSDANALSGEVNLNADAPAKDPTDSLNSSNLGAWILPVSGQAHVAVGKHELKYIEYISHCVSLPGLPAFCEQGFVWRNRFIPVLDIHSLVTRRRMPATDKEQLAAIIAYENTEGELTMGAILLRGVPKLSAVKPTQSVPLTDIAPEFQLLSHAAFRDGDNLYPVLDLPGLFNRTPVDLLYLH